MNNLNNAYGDTIETRLRYIGATNIKKINGILYFIEFKIDNKLKVSYTYNINSKNKYYLQRIKPYPIPQGVFEEEYEIVSFIEQDIKKFLNAKKSNNFDLFLNITDELNTISIDIENIFLNYNMDKNDLENLKYELDNILNLFKNSKNKSPKINLLDK